MLENLALLGIIIIVLWLISLAFYFRVSRQHKEIQQEIEALRALLDEKTQDG
ncbi:MAG: hypothetical protein AB1791_17755 [Chloroflexota bacterium]